MTAAWPGFLGIPKRPRPPALQLLAFDTIRSGAATLDIPLDPYPEFTDFKLRLMTFIPVTDAVFLAMRFSKDGGGAFDTGASDYAYEFRTHDNTGSFGDSDGASTSVIMTTSFIGSGAAEGVSGWIDLYDLRNGNVWPRAEWRLNYVDSSATPRHVRNEGSGARGTAQQTNALRLLFNSGAISRGRWALYGWNVSV